MLLRPLARFWVGSQNEAGEWSYHLATYTEFLGSARGTTRVSKGTLELLAQTCNVSWVTTSDTARKPLLRRQRILLPAVFMTTGEASTIFDAVEASHC